MIGEAGLDMMIWEEQWWGVICVKLKAKCEQRCLRGWSMDSSPTQAKCSFSPALRSANQGTCTRDSEWVNGEIW